MLGMLKGIISEAHKIAEGIQTKSRWVDAPLIR